jgi:hypothetical protein
MRCLIQHRMRTSNHRLRLIVLLAIVLGSHGAVLAGLGGDLDSIHTDQDKLIATVKFRQMNAYSIYEMKMSSGTLVREYVSSSGRVFGVAWQGPFIPDMQRILGSYFERYAQLAKAQRANHVGRQPLSIQQPDLVVQTAGHMRAYSGRAYDPELLPAGVGPDELW